MAQETTGLKKKRKKKKKGILHKIRPVAKQIKQQGCGN